MTPAEKTKLILTVSESLLRKFRLFYSQNYPHIKMSELTTLSVNIDSFFDACATIQASPSSQAALDARHNAYMAAAKIAGIMSAHGHSDPELTYFLQTIA